MSLTINTNVASLNAQRNLAINSQNLGVSVQRLSSGLRINSAKDDAAGLSISEKLRAHVRSINVAVRNSQDGISLSQTAEGGLSEIGGILGRMRELATQSANGTLANGDRNAIEKEFGQLASEIDRISNVTEFNGQKLLDGSLSGGVAAPQGPVGNTGPGQMSLQVGFKNDASANNWDQINFQVAKVDTAGLKVTKTGGNYVNTVTNARNMITTLDNAIATVSDQRGNLGAIQNRLDSTISNLRIAAENLSAADSRVRDADFAVETSTFTKNQILTQSATAILAQANTLPQAALQLLR